MTDDEKLQYALQYVIAGYTKKAQGLSEPGGSYNSHNLSVAKKNKEHTNLAACCGSTTADHTGAPAYLPYNKGIRVGFNPATVLPDDTKYLNDKQVCPKGHVSNVAEKLVVVKELPIFFQYRIVQQDIVTEEDDEDDF